MELKKNLTITGLFIIGLFCFSCAEKTPDIITSALPLPFRLVSS